jgi:hypothetical protein
MEHLKKLRACTTWNQTTGRAIRTKKDVKILYTYLDAIQSNIFSIQKEYALRNEPITSEQVRSKILLRDEEKQHCLVEVYKYHNAQFENWWG